MTVIGANLTVVGGETGKPDYGNDDGDLGLIIGIAVGGVILAIMMGIVIYYCCQKKIKTNKPIYEIFQKDNNS